MLQQFKTRQFLVFLMTGGIAALTNFCSRILLNFWFSFSASIIIAYVIGMFVAFILFKKYVFASEKQDQSRSVMFFIIVNLFAVAQTWLISMGMAIYVLPKLGIHTFSNEIAHATGIVVPAFTSFIGHKYWTFREH